MLRHRNRYADDLLGGGALPLRHCGEPIRSLKMAQCQLRMSEARRAEFGADAPASDR